MRDSGYRRKKDGNRYIDTEREGKRDKVREKDCGILRERNRMREGERGEEIKGKTVGAGGR